MRTHASKLGSMRGPMLGAVAALVSCARELPPLGEAVLAVDTDVPVPAIGGTLRLDVFRRDETGAMTWLDSREVVREDVRDWPLSFSIYAPEGVARAEAVVRLRLYPSGKTRDYRGERFLDLPSPDGDPNERFRAPPPPVGDAPRLLRLGKDLTPTAEPDPLVTIDVSIVCLGACAVEPLPPPGQLLLFVDTDAVVPGEARAPRFDRVEIAVFAPGATEPCDGCTRAFAVDTQAFRDRRVSVGIPRTATMEGFRARVRLYWAGEAGVPRPTYTIERTIALPPRGESEVREVWFYLPTEGVARPAGTLSAPQAPDARTAESRVGTFRLAGPIPCGLHPNEPAAVCVPGGTFWMDRSDSLTAVSPFWIDATEVTVRSARAQGARFLEPPPSEVTAPSTNYCTAKAKDDLLPANCIRTTQATAVCEARGGRLPTEAEWEYLASQLGASRFPWGNDAPTCGDAVVGRGEGVEPIGAVFCTRLDAAKYPPGPTRVPGPGAPHGRDVVHLAGGDVFDLGGNMGELVADDAALVGGPCWAPGGLRIDPRCVDPARSELSNARGGSYFFPRFAGSPFPGRTPSSFERGFRCAYPAR